MRDNTQREENRFQQEDAKAFTLAASFSEVVGAAIDLGEVHLRTKSRQLVNDLKEETPKGRLLALLALPIIMGIALYGFLFNLGLILVRQAMKSYSAEVSALVVNGGLLTLGLFSGWLFLRRRVSK